MSRPKSPTPRSYEQHCGLARALDVVGERWTLLVVRDLLLGPRRYGELLASLEGITTNLLAKRLRELTRRGIVEKRRLPRPVSVDVYALTEAGRALEPAVMELARWGGRLLEHPRPEDRRDIGWALLSMKRRYTGGHDFVAEIACGDRRFELGFGPAGLAVAERPGESAEVRARAADQETFFDVFFRAVPTEAHEASGLLQVEGRRDLWNVVLRSFAPPVPAPRREVPLLPSRKKR